MAPYWEKRFVPNSYACRPGLGPLKAGQDLNAFIRCHMRHVKTPLYYLKMDVQNFFTTIDLKILYRIIEKHLENPLYFWLCHVVIFHRATAPGHFILSSPKSLWRMMPRYKSLFYAPEHVGLPIGNLTSQFFANIYLGQFDQYVRHKLKGRYLYWQRYVDDILFLSDQPDTLRNLVPLVKGFLQDELNLTCNPKKTLLQPLCRGLDHLGYFFKPSFTTPRRRVMGAARQKVREVVEKELAPDRVASSINSYLGHLSLRLRQEIAGIHFLFSAVAP